MINTEAVKKQADVVAAWQKRLTEATNHLECIRRLNGHGQTGYSVSIGGRQIQIAAMDQRTYNAYLIRGMEMIHLGALKALAGEIRDVEARLLAEESKLSELSKEKS